MSKSNGLNFRSNLVPLHFSRVTAPPLYSWFGYKSCGRFSSHLTTFQSASLVYSSPKSNLTTFTSIFTSSIDCKGLLATVLVFTNSFTIYLPHGGQGYFLTTPFPATHPRNGSSVHWKWDLHSLMLAKRTYSRGSLLLPHTAVFFSPPRSLHSRCIHSFFYPCASSPSC